MSKSKRDQKGKRINGEILGHGCFSVIGDRLIARCGGEEVGSPNRKLDAKHLVARLRRADTKRSIIKELRNQEAN